MNRLLSGLFVCTSLVAIVIVSGQTVPLDTVVVTAMRAESTTGTEAFSTRILSANTLRDSPSLTLDSALRSVPAFGLFRRSDSLTAHPTTQGVSLRGLGPSGASRSLVLLDGIPVNDPFGGWVNWTQLPRESLARVEIVSGGGATAWGNSALGGVVQLVSEDLGAKAGRVAVTVGDFDTRNVEFSLAKNAGESAIEVSGDIFSSDGYSTVAPESRGSIDQPAGNHHHWFSGRWRQAFSDNVTATLTARVFHEARQNGTPYQVNSTDEEFVSAEVVGRPSRDFQWNAAAYGLDESFVSTFSAVNAARTAETPASFQYDVPASAAGAAWTGEWSRVGGGRVVVGGDLRSVRGESRESYSYTAGQFTRLRAAGGRQATGGVFVLHERELAPGLNATVGSRLDYWQDASGLRREVDAVSGALLRDDQYPTRDGWEWSPSAGLVWKASSGVRVRLSGQHAYRRPTLNELYRPFRVGSIVTEANASLGTETVDTLESGIEAVWGQFTASATAFWNELHGAVSNVTIARGPGTFPLFGTLPVGGIGRQRQNLDRVRVRGIELSGRWEWTEHWAVTADTLVNDAEVTKATAAPNLEGLRVAEVPRVSGSLGLEWHGLGGWRVSPRVRYIGSQFDDDENQLRLAPALVTDCAVAYALTHDAEAFVSVENLFDERIETGRSAAGVINVGTRRFATGGVRMVW